MKNSVRWAGRIIGGLVAVIVSALATLYVLGGTKLTHTYSTTVETLPVSGDPASIERGRHLVTAVGKCAGCHGPRLEGTVMIDNAMFARLTAPNITPARSSVTANMTDQDLVRSIRYGVRKDGKSLVLMPSEAFNRFSDRDLAAVIAYLRTVPPVDSVPPAKRSFGLIARGLIVFGALPLPAEIVRRGSDRLPDVPEGPTREYGEYLVTTGGCTGCHGPTLSGGREMDGVPAANLTPAALGKWSEADFVKAIRNGVRPDGRILSAVMPWPLMKELTDTELRAMWLYLQSIPPKKTGE
jgi:mono/diheme cytochrome c family protein